jgi:hypothetical protein
MSERGPHCETCTCGCTCGYGGQHEPENPHCELNRGSEGTMSAPYSEVTPC